MRKSATELMKRLKAIQEEISDIHNDDMEKSYVPLVKNEGEKEYSPMYESGYDFTANRKRVKELHQEERQIKNALSAFNNRTFVDGYDFTISEGLVRLSQLKSEIRMLSTFVKRGRYSNVRYNSEQLSKACFDEEEARRVLKETQEEYNALQVAVDRTNLNSKIEY